MANIFDQFDAAPRGAPPNANIFDQFDPPAEAKPLPPPAASAIPRGFVSGVRKGVPESLAGAAEMMGFDTIGGKLRALAATAPEGYQPRVPTLADIPGEGIVDTLSRGSTFVGEQLGNVFATTLPAVGAGLLGAAAGAPAGPVGAAAGAIGGAAGSSYLLNSGELYNSLLEAGADRDTARKWSMWAGVPMAGLDVTSLGLITKALTGPARKEAYRGIAKRLMAESGKGMLSEGTTEGAQQAIQEAVVAEVAERPLLTPDVANKVATAIVGGAIGGAALRAPAGLRQPAPQAPAEAAPPPAEEGTPPLALPPPDTRGDGFSMRAGGPPRGPQTTGRQFRPETETIEGEAVDTPPPREGRRTDAVVDAEYEVAPVDPARRLEYREPETQTFRYDPDIPTPPEPPPSQRAITYQSPIFSPTQRAMHAVAQLPPGQPVPNRMLVDAAGVKTDAEMRAIRIALQDIGLIVKDKNKWVRAETPTAAPPVAQPSGMETADDTQGRRQASGQVGGRQEARQLFDQGPGREAAETGRILQAQEGQVTAAALPVAEPPDAAGRSAEPSPVEVGQPRPAPGAVPGGIGRESTASAELAERPAPEAAQPVADIHVGDSFNRMPKLRDAVANWIARQSGPAFATTDGYAYTRNGAFVFTPDGDKFRVKKQHDLTSDGFRRAVGRENFERGAAWLINNRQAEDAHAEEMNRRSKKEQDRRAKEEAESAKQQVEEESRHEWLNSDSGPKALTWKRQKFTLHFDKPRDDGQSSEEVVGYVHKDLFGIDKLPDRRDIKYRVTHIPTGLRMTGLPELSLDLAKEYVARLLPIADWTKIRSRKDAAPVGAAANEEIRRHRQGMAPSWYKAVPRSAQEATDQEVEAERSAPKAVPDAAAPIRAPRTEAKPEAPPQRPVSLVEFIASKGGLNDSHPVFRGEAAARDWHRLFIRNPRGRGSLPLVRRGGHDLDTLAELAAEAGYISSRDVNELLRAMERDVRARFAKNAAERVYPAGAETDRFIEFVRGAKDEDQEAARLSAVADGLGIPYNPQATASELQAKIDEFDRLADEAEREAIHWADTARKEVPQNAQGDEFDIPFDVGRAADRQVAPDTRTPRPPAEAGDQSRAGENDPGERRQDTPDEGYRGGPIGRREPGPQGPPTESVQTEDGPRDQYIVPGTEKSARQAREARDAQNQGRIRKGPNKPIEGTGLFDTEGRKQDDLFSDRRTTRAAVEDGAPTFFSALTRGVEGLAQPKAPADQWARSIRNLTQKGVKQSEIDWSGVMDWLRERDGQSVTKDDVLAFLRANEVQVEEVVKGDRGPPTEEEIAALRDWARNNLGVDDDTLEDTLQSAEKGGITGLYVLTKHGAPDAILAPFNAISDGGYSRPDFEDQQLPGGENYRELLLKLPDRGTGWQVRQRGDGNGYELVNDQGLVYAWPETGKPAIFDTRGFAEGWALSLSRRGGDFDASHFREPNILAHVRFNERTDADGKRVLFIEEIQSDWHQKGRKRGYRRRVTEEGILEGWKIVDRSTPSRPRWVVLDEQGDIVDTRSSKQDLLYSQRLLAARNEIRQESIPDGPFKTEWHELAMKRMFRWAAEHGYDRVAWTTGEQQVDRYNNVLRKTVDSIAWEKTPAGVHLKGMRRSHVVVDTTERETALSDAIGKAMAEKIIADPNQSGTIEGDDLTISDTALPTLYDRILTSVANKLGKKWGAKVGETAVQLPTGHSTALPWWGEFDPPPEHSIAARLSAEFGDDGTQWYSDKGTSIEDRARELGGQQEFKGSVGFYIFKDSTYIGFQNDGTWAVGGLMSTATTQPLTKFHSIDVTPAMRESVLAGQPMWAVDTESQAAAPSISPADTAKLDTLAAELQKIADRLFPGLKVKTRAGPIREDGRELAAQYTRIRGLGAFAEVSMRAASGRLRSAEEMAGLLGHEGIHYLRDIGILKNDWTTLANAEKVHGWRAKYRIEDKYAGKSQDERTEESVAHAFADWWFGAKTPTRVAAIFERVRRVIEGIKDWWHGRSSDYEAVFRRIREGGYARQARAAVELPAGETTRDAAAWHGTPHDFDQFSLHKIGTGEGSQAFGWGLYFAGRKAVAQYYKDSLSNQYSMDHKYWEGVKLPPRLNVEERERFWALGRQMRREGNLPDAQMKEWQTLKDKDSAYNDAVEAARPRGRLYEVDLVPAENEYLDWDRPLSHQSEKVRAALTKAGVDGAGKRGWQIYEMLAEKWRARRGAEGPRLASEELAAAGIPGIRYLDAGSRAEGEGTHNYVIFDDKLVNVVSKSAAEDAEAAAAIEAATGDKVTPEEMAEARGPLYRQRAAVEGTAEEEAAISRIMGSSKIPVGRRIADWLAEWKQDGMRRFRQGMFDQYDSIAVAEKQVYGKLLDAEHSHYKRARMLNVKGMVYHLLHHGMLEFQDGRWQSRPGFEGGLYAIFSPLAQAGKLRLWEGYAIARRAKELKGQDRENLLTDAEIETLLKLGDKHPEFREAHRKWSAFNAALLDLAEKAGSLNPEVRKLFESREYVPFYRIIEGLEREAGPGRRRGLAGQRMSTRRLEGGTEKINDLIENIVRNVTHIMDSAAKNQAAKEAVDVGIRAGMAKRAAVAGKPWLVSDETLADILKTETDGAIDFNALSDDEKKAFRAMVDVVQPKARNLFSVMFDGKPRYYTALDPLFLRSMTSFDWRLGETLMIRLMAGAKNLLTRGVTSFPDFMLRNALRDSASAWVLTGGRTNPFSAAKGFAESLNESASMQAIRAAGADATGWYPVDPEAISGELRRVDQGKAAKHLVEDLWHKWEAIGRASDNANRIALYKQLVKEGKSEAEALYQAQDLMDFSMRGDFAAIRFLIAVVPFMNARMQGLYRLGRGAKEDPRSFFMRGGVLTAASLALLYANMGEDWYEELGDEDRDNNYHVKIGDTIHRLPKPFEVGSIFSTIPERMARWFNGTDDGEKLRKSLAQVWLNTFAMNPVPQLFMPAMEQWANKVTFTGAPIETSAMQRLLPGARKSDRTSAIAEGLGILAPETISPARVDALLRGYFGTLGSVAMSASNILRDTFAKGESPAWRIEDYPIAGWFMRRQPARTTQFLRDFYDLNREIQQVAATARDLAKSGKSERAMELLKEHPGAIPLAQAGNRVEDQLSKIGKELRSIREDEHLTGMAKRTRIDELIAQRNALAKRGYLALKQAREAASR